MGSRRIFSKEMKRSVIQQLDSRSAAELCREYEILPTLLHRWKQEYEANPQEAFKGKGNISTAEAKVAHYERLIGQLYAEIDLLKKRTEHLRHLRAEQLTKKQGVK